MAQVVNADSWELLSGPDPMIPWEDFDTSAAWVWTLRHRRTGEVRELSVRVSWKGFHSIDEVPSLMTRNAFVESGRPGVTWFLSQTFDRWAEVIFHSQTHGTPHGSTGRQQIIRLSEA